VPKLIHTTVFNILLDKVDKVFFFLLHAIFLCPNKLSFLLFMQPIHSKTLLTYTYSFNGTFICSGVQNHSGPIILYNECPTNVHSLACEYPWTVRDALNEFLFFW